ncbi:hypothetical protein FKG94_18175 [Exilibacterium tricleocarpae]|uniref:DUF3598 domain-containing protein n=1 Tax=Exilibacterium tricleocarpae TaxID=2591008 RepID=A0A545T5V9_9GAMM|nr:hypothetical protein [Exilibacterium tricleocarpae]TQV72621.1 hypothetical protein FKG94_18175 [Exilibacterium tricleocarpae]
MTNPLQDLMPSVLAHAGTWVGSYRHIDSDGNTLDFHRSRVECVFPERGPVVYLQKNQFTWEDGRCYRVEFGGVLRDGRIYWDTETFRGCGWAAGAQVFLLDLERKDEPGARFYETIVMDAGQASRARTWHWFKDGRCYKRTLCDERRLD